LFLGDISE